MYVCMCLCMYSRLQKVDMDVRRVMLVFLLSLVWGWRTVRFKLSGGFGVPF